MDANKIVHPAAQTGSYFQDAQSWEYNSCWIDDSPPRSARYRAGGDGAARHPRHRAERQATEPNRVGSTTRPLVPPAIARAGTAQRAIPTIGKRQLHLRCRLCHTVNSPGATPRRPGRGLVDGRTPGRFAFVDRPPPINSGERYWPAAAIRDAPPKPSAAPAGCGRRSPRASRGAASGRPPCPSAACANRAPGGSCCAPANP